MPRRKPFPFRLDSSGVKSLPHTELVAILRGADSMIGQGGRSLLSKLLKGSREAAIVTHDLMGCPSYGFFRDLTIDEILHRIDWTIEHDYLDIGYQGQLPVLIFTDRGWAIEIETMAEELLRGFESRLGVGPPFDMSHLKDRNREMVFLLLDKIERSGRRDFLPLLAAWAKIDYAKVRARIAMVERALATETPA